MSTHRTATRLAGLARRRGLRVRGLFIVRGVDRPVSGRLGRGTIGGGPVGCGSVGRGLGRGFSAPSAAPAADLTALIAAAKAEGNLTTIALPRDWCNYGAAIDGFTTKYGIKINGLNPDGGSKDELDAIIANKDNPGPQAPDVIDVGLAFGPQGVDQRPLPAVQGLDLGHHPGLGQVG